MQQKPHPTHYPHNPQSGITPPRRTMPLVGRPHAAAGETAEDGKGVTESPGKDDVYYSTGEGYSGKGHPVPGKGAHSGGELTRLLDNKDKVVVYGAYVPSELPGEVHGGESPVVPTEQDDAAVRPDEPDNSPLPVPSSSSSREPSHTVHARDNS